jgi:hypothetical protein
MVLPADKRWKAQTKEELDIQPIFEIGSSDLIDKR